MMNEEPPICPECKTQLDWWHQYAITHNKGEEAKRFWACLCGKMFVTIGGMIQ